MNKNLTSYGLIGVSLALVLSACGGGSGGQQRAPAEQPRVLDIIPVANSTNVPRDTAITANLYLPTAGKGVDAKTLAGNVRLYRSDNQKAVIGVAATDGADGNITFQPTRRQLPGGLLEAKTKYTFEVTSGVKDQNGVSFVPFKASFTTGDLPQPEVPEALFSKKQVYPVSGMRNLTAPITSVDMGPDGKLYAVNLAGELMRWTVNSTGDLTNLEVLPDKAELKGRALIGLAFDPGNPRVIWVSNNAPLWPQPAPDFSGKITKITLNSTGFDGIVQDYVVGLPRSTKDHLTNSLTFGPDGKLYVSQGSNTSTGAYDTTWARDERLLSGAVLQIDTTRTSNLPINVQTEGTATPYNPDEPDAPVRIFADGVRNAFDLVWHSNGKLYLPVNGGAAGGSTPDQPGGVKGLVNVPNQNDYLHKIEPGGGGYYGHPNPLRNRYILNGGNPTAQVDPAEVVTQGQYQGYPVGTMPEKDFRFPVHNFGPNRSPNGVIEYKSSALNGKLQKKLMVAEYSLGDDVVVLTLDSQGKVTRAGRLGDAEHGFVADFADPLDITEGRDGNLYVAEMVPGPDASTPPTARITLLRPVR